MLKKLIHFQNENNGSIAFDWVVLTAGVLSLGIAVTLTATHNANAASPQETTLIVLATTTN